MKTRNYADAPEKATNASNIHCLDERSHVYGMM